MIPLRLFLRALAYILDGRAAWLEAKVTRNRNPKETAEAGRLRASANARAQAKSVGSMSHETDQRGGPIDVPAALVGLALSRATGHLEQDDELRAEMARVTDPKLNAELDRLINIGVLPLRQKKA